MIGKQQTAQLELGRILTKLMCLWAWTIFPPWKVVIYLFSLEEKKKKDVIHLSINLITVTITFENCACTFVRR